MSASQGDVSGSGQSPRAKRREEAMAFVNGQGDMSFRERLSLLTRLKSDHDLVETLLSLPRLNDPQMLEYVMKEYASEQDRV